MESLDFATCDVCGRSIPTGNSLVHNLRCHQENTTDNCETKEYAIEMGRERDHMIIVNEYDISKETETETVVDSLRKESCVEGVQLVEDGEGSEDHMWACPCCTYINEGNSSRLLCAMCHHCRVEDASHLDAAIVHTCLNDENENCDIYESRVDYETSSHETPSWICPHCTFINDLSEDSCQMCETNTEDLNAQRTEAMAWRDAVNAAMPALGYIGMAVGSTLASSSNGSSHRFRNGLIGSLLGTAVGFGVSLYTAYNYGNIVNGRANSASDRLPVHRYHSSNFKGERDIDKSSCRICMEDYEEDVEIKSLKCFHMFHADCVDKWLGQKSTCPLCNTAI